jgi:hypothetical protein
MHNGHTARYNHRTSRYLAKILDAHKWNEKTLAQRTGISRSMVSRHLTGKRKISVEHLTAYWRSILPTERNGLLTAWLVDIGWSARDIEDAFFMLRTRNGHRKPKRGLTGGP